MATFVTRDVTAPIVPASALFGDFRHEGLVASSTAHQVTALGARRSPVANPKGNRVKLVSKYLSFFRGI